MQPSMCGHVRGISKLEGNLDIEHVQYQSLFVSLLLAICNASM